MTVPTEITAGTLAGILGVTERRVAALKAEGRIPMAENGKVLLHDLLAQQHTELAKARQQPRTARRIAVPGSWDDQHPADAIARVAMRYLVRAALPRHMQAAAEAAGIRGEQLQILTAAMADRAQSAESEARAMCGILIDPDGPEGPDTI